MSGKGVPHIISSLKRKWIISRLMYYLFVSAAIGILIFIPVSYIYPLSFIWAVLASLVVFCIFLISNHSWQAKDEDVIRFLNREYPDLEESAALLVMPAGSLNGLQSLQRNKIERVLGTVIAPARWNNKPIAGFVVLLTVVLASFGFSKLSLLVNNDMPASDFSVMHSSNLPIPPEISSLQITIQPPAYTGLNANTQHHADIRAAEDAVIEWTLNVSGSVHTASLLLNDAKVIPLEPDDNGRSVWTGRLNLKSSGYYQIVLDSVKSSIYPIEVIKDQLPDIHVHTPNAETWIAYGSPGLVNVKVSLSDDYGIRHSEILATVSSGSGEAVKFQQHKIAFPESFGMRMKNYTLNRKLDLAALHMKPGDDLYFYIRATDTKNQEKKSDVYIVRLEDTAQLFSMEGLLTGVDLKPEFFRSQRQIIIETEQLIRDQSRLIEKDFKDKSSSLGIDQKLLRLRYGKFLGEEAVTFGSGAEESVEHKEGEEDHRHQPEKTSSPGDALSRFGHSHDNAEDATFFDPETKKQLRAILNEMWKAELQLRLAEPVKALPFEYKALRLLKDLQQKSRVYVAKTSQKPTLLSNSKRLTGELDKIVEPVKHYTPSFPPYETEPLRRALSILSSLKNTAGYIAEDIKVLGEVSKALARQAVESPAGYIAALESLRSIIASLEEDSPLRYTDLLKSEQALQTMVSLPMATPSRQDVSTGVLSDQYFQTLQQIQRR